MLQITPDHFFSWLSYSSAKECKIELQMIPNKKGLFGLPQQHTSATSLNRSCMSKRLTFSGSGSGTKVIIFLSLKFHAFTCAFQNRIRAMRFCFKIGVLFVTGFSECSFYQNIRMMVANSSKPVFEIIFKIDLTLGKIMIYSLNNTFDAIFFSHRLHVIFIFKVFRRKSIALFCAKGVVIGLRHSAQYHCCLSDTASSIFEGSDFPASYSSGFSEYASLLGQSSSMKTNECDNDH
ncbi:hypothetical protein Ahy_A03g016317 isoform B [Arachis hypogaea]|uniref:Uncharacterized protein n=1 Tax=Arachis hypogaea TaxID=3818 RepID=A0A445E2V0_ARAHY|nr:hypothetical protein Ahy_A03g016317 isoform B [Arachis hypogaea]